MKFQFALAFLVILAFSLPTQSKGFQYCGSILSEALVKYCQSGPTEKRSESWMRTQLFGTGYWLAPKFAMAMGRGKRQRGIATECCENSCSIDKLLAYCPTDD